MKRNPFFIAADLAVDAAFLLALCVWLVGFDYRVGNVVIFWSWTWAVLKIFVGWMVLLEKCSPLSEQSVAQKAYFMAKTVALVSVLAWAGFVYLPATIIVGSLSYAAAISKSEDDRKKAAAELEEALEDKNASADAMDKELRLTNALLSSERTTSKQLADCSEAQVKRITELELEAEQLEREIDEFRAALHEIYGCAPIRDRDYMRKVAHDALYGNDVKIENPAPNSYKPIAWLLDWPNEPDLGHFFSEAPINTVRSLPLYTFPQTNRTLLRRIVDAVWKAATESENVPATEWADRIIDSVAPGCDNQTDRVSELGRKATAQARLIQSLEAQRTELRAQQDKAREAIATLESERTANAKLTAEVERLRAALSRLLISDPTGAIAIANATDDELRFAVNDERADPVVREQAASILQARAALSGKEAQS